ncbi:MAG: two-component regulator propeller domain-containing protein [Terracidiphilus sp.]
MRRRFAFTAALCCIVAACCPCALALDPSLDISQYAHTAWKNREGFTRGGINAIAQTSDGYIWLGTEFGLLRFDGVRTYPWEPPAGTHLPGNNVTRLLAARDGTLWIGTRDGLASLNRTRLTEYPKLEGEAITALTEDHEETIWAGTAGKSGEVCAIRGITVECDGQHGRLGFNVAALHEDSLGNLWAATWSGLWRWRPGSPKLYQATGIEQPIRDLLEEGKGAMLLAARDGMKELVNGSVEEAPLPGVRSQLKLTRILRDRNGGLWIGIQDQGLAHVHQGKTDLFRRSTISPVQGLSDPNVWSVLGARDGSVWLGTVRGANRWKDGQITIYRKAGAEAVSSAQRALGVREVTDSGLPEDGVDSLYQDDDGRVWVSTLRGVSYFENGRFHSVTGVPGGVALAMAGDHDGNLWIGNRAVGLLHLLRGNVMERIPWNSLGSKDAAQTLFVDPLQGGLWIGFLDGGVAYYKDGRVRASYKVADGLGNGEVTDLQIDRDGALWAATQGGLSRIKNGRVNTLTSKNGLPCDTVHWRMDDDSHSVWLLTACGLVRIARSDLDAWSADPERTVSTTVFDTSDGVVSHPTTSGFSPRVAKSTDGKIWFLPFDGVSVLDPRHIPFNSIPPPVHVEQITADRKTYNLDTGASGHMRLPPQVRDLEIDYTALSLVVPKKNLFRYKLEGYDNDWQDPGNRRQAFYTNLPPGTYHFHLIACNNSGVWNEAGATLDFAILPAYYQTLWFKLLCVVAFLAILWVLYLRRLQQLRYQFAIGMEARVNERTRVARELHDTLLQSFQGAVFQFQAARRLLLRNADNTMQVMDEAIQAAEQGITEGRAAIQDLRPEPAAQRDLPELLNDAGRELAESYKSNGHAASYLVVVEGKQRNLSPMLQDEVYRISREVIRNAFAHAVASHIEVEIRYDRDQLRVRIRDDGKGIDAKILEAGGQSGHWGITGMRERAQRIGAQLAFWSEAGAGTEVQLSVPGAIAYMKHRDARRFRLFRRAGRDE